MTWRKRKRRRKGGGADEGPWGGGGGIQIQKSRHGGGVVHGVEVMVVVGMVLSNGRVLVDAAAAAVRGCCGLHTTNGTRTRARGARQSLRPFDQPPMPREGGGEAGGSDAAAAALVFSSLRMVGWT